MDVLEDMEAELVRGAIDRCRVADFEVIPRRPSDRPQQVAAEYASRATAVKTLHRLVDALDLLAVEASEISKPALA